MAAEVTSTIGRSNLISIHKTSAYPAHVLHEIGGEYDYEVQTQDGCLPCHRKLLEAMSPFVEEQMSTEIKDSESANPFKDLSGEIVALLVHFMYTGSVSFEEPTLKEFLAAVHILQIDFLKDPCLDQVLSVLKPRNAVQWWKYSLESKIKDVEINCTAFIASHLVEISKESEFQDMDFADVMIFFTNAVLEFARHEDALFSMLEWVAHDTARCTHLQELLESIDLRNCHQKALMKQLDRYVEIVGQEKFNPEIYKLLSAAVQQKEEQKNCDAKLCVISGHYIPKHDIVRNIFNTQESNLDSRVHAKLKCWAIVDEHCTIELCDIPFEELRLYHSVCETPEGFVISGGLKSRLCVMYNSLTDTWTRLPNLTVPRMFHGSLCIRDVLYVFGGHGTSGEPSESVQCLVLSEAGSEWQEFIPLPEAAYQNQEPFRFTRVAAVGDSVYLLGNDRCMYRLTIGTDAQWHNLAKVPREVLRFDIYSMTHANGKLHLIGDHMHGWFNLEVNRWKLMNSNFSNLLDFSQDTSYHLACHNNTVSFHDFNRIYNYSLSDKAWRFDADCIPTTNSHMVVMRIPRDRIKTLRVAQMKLCPLLSRVLKLGNATVTKNDS